MNAHASAARAERTKAHHIGDHLREWRQRRHLSQLDLAGDAEISARHLSFVETGRAAPSREMVLKLAERLEVPLRERNVLLVAAGFAPAFPQRSLDDPALKSARAAIDLVLKAHEPNPALAYDRHWNLVTANRMVAPLLAGIPQRLLGQPLNILRLAFHPEALAARTVNLAEWCGHLLERLHRQCEVTADPELLKLYQELKAYPIPARSVPLSADNVAIPLKLRSEGGEVLSFFSTTMVFGTPVDITLSELALETFFPADDLTARADAGDGGQSDVIRRMGGAKRYPSIPVMTPMGFAALHPSYVLAGFSRARKENASKRAARSVRLFDQAFQQAFQFCRGLVAVILGDEGFLAERQRIQALGQCLSAIGREHQHLAPVVGILDPVDEGVGHHPVDHLGQGRMIEQYGFGELTHRVALAIGKNFQNTPLLDRHAFLPESRVELTIDLPVRLRKQIGEMLGDRFAGRFGQGFALRNGGLDEYFSVSCLFYMHGNR